MHNNKFKVGVLGAGAWGTAIAKILSEKENVLLWAKEKSVCSDVNNKMQNKKYLPNIKLNRKILCTNDLNDLGELSFLFLVVPTQYIQPVLKQFKKKINNNCIIVCCSKGIEIKSLKLSTELVSSLYPKNQIAVMSGPNFALEVAKDLPAATLIAAKQNGTAKKVAKLIQSKTFRPYLSNDVIGAQIAGALKNIYAIACGIAVGKHFGENAVASIISRGFAEICLVGKAFRAKKETLSGLSGMGDLFLTCSSKKSRNFTLGTELAQGTTLQSLVNKKSSIAEGVFTARALKKLAVKHKLILPIGETVYQILYRNKNIDSAIKDLLNRPIRKE